MVPFSKMHGALPGIAPGMSPKLYFQPLSGLQSRRHSGYLASRWAVKQTEKERCGFGGREKRCGTRFAANSWPQINCNKQWMSRSMEGECSPEALGLKDGGPALWYIKVRPRDISLCDRSRRPQGLATLPAVAHYTLTPLDGPPPARLRFNYTRRLDPRKKKVAAINLWARRGKEKVVAFDGKA